MSNKTETKHKNIENNSKTFRIVLELFQAH